MQVINLLTYRNINGETDERRGRKSTLCTKSAQVSFSTTFTKIFKMVKILFSSELARLLWNEASVLG